MYHRCPLDYGERCYQCVPQTVAERVCFWVGLSVFTIILVVRGF